MNTRRRFLQSGAAVAAGLGGPAVARAAQAASQVPGRPPGPDPLDRAPESPPAIPLAPASELQVPKVKFGSAEISRLILGCNPFYGFAHFNSTLGAMMRQWYTPDRVCGVLHQCTRFGINTYNYVPLGRAPADWERFRSEGGSMHLIVQGLGDPEPLVGAIHPLAIYHHGEMTDRAFREGKLASVREYCKRLRQLGVLVGVGSHIPEVIAQVEEEGWDIDFFAGCVYNRSRTPQEIRNLLDGELPLPAGELYLEGDPERMYAVMRQTAKPCFAFKILAAGRLDQPDVVDRAYRTAFQSIKPGDCVFVGMFPFLKDEVRENAGHVSRILKSIHTGACQPVWREQTREG